MGMVAVEEELELVVTMDDSALTSGIMGITLLFELACRLNVNGVSSWVWPEEMADVKDVFIADVATTFELRRAWEWE